MHWWCLPSFAIGRLKERDLKRDGLDDDVDDSEDSDEHEEFIANISKKSISSIRRVRASRILRSSTNSRFPPTEMIAASNIHDGTYRYFDIHQRIAQVLNNFEVATRRQGKFNFVYEETYDMKHLHGYISYTAVIRWQRQINYRPSRMEKNTFWETGYVGESGGGSLLFYQGKCVSSSTILHTKLKMPQEFSRTIIIGHQH